MLKKLRPYRKWILILSILIFNVPFLMYKINEYSRNSEKHPHHHHHKRSLLDALQTEEFEWSKGQEDLIEYPFKNSEQHYRSKRSIQPQELEWSKGQEDAAIFKKLLKLSKVSEMCADFQPGKEGHLHNDSKKFQLVQVHLFVSPGQIIPEREIPALRLPSISCKFSRLLSDHPKVQNFQETIYMFQNLQQGHNAFKVFPPNPKKHVCSKNDLTPFGSLQLIRNGEFLSKAYSKYVSSNIPLDSLVNIQSISEKLHYQSALAFSHGFLEREQFARSRVEKSLPNFAPKSMNANINCPKVNRYSFMMEDGINSGLYVYKRGHPSTKKLANLLKSQHVVKSSALELVVTLLLYFCNKLSPSCFDAKPGAKCLNVTSEGLNAAFNMADSYMQSLTLDPMFKDISSLSTFPALKQVIDKMTNIKNSAFFHIYSGKYSFLLYLLRTLDVRIDGVPPAASRIALEVYKHTTDNSTFFRLLFNGKDVTANVLSCKTFSSHFSGLCPYSVLKDYVNYGILAKFNSESYEQACK